MLDRMRASHLAGVIAAMVVTASAAQADEVSVDGRANQRVAAAEAHAKAGRFVEAAVAFREAYALVPDVRYLCNVGVAYHRAPDYARAQIYLTECVVRGSSLDAKFVSTVRRTLDAVEGELRTGDFTPVDISVDPSNAVISFDQFAPGETFVGSRVFWVPFGAHVVTVNAEGYTAQTRSIDAQSHTHRVLRVELPRASVEGVTPPVEPVKPPTEPTTPSVGSRAERPSATPAIIATAATGALTVGAVVTYLTARSLAKKVDPNSSQTDYDAQTGRARSRQHLSWGLGAAAGVGAIVSGYLWYRRSTTTIEVTPAGGGATVSVGGTW